MSCASPYVSARRKKKENGGKKHSLCALQRWRLSWNPVSPLGRYFFPVFTLLGVNLCAPLFCDPRRYLLLYVEHPWGKWCQPTLSQVCYSPAGFYGPKSGGLPPISICLSCIKGLYPLPQVLAPLPRGTNKTRFGAFPSIGSLSAPNLPLLTLKGPNSRKVTLIPCPKTSS